MRVYKSTWLWTRLKQVGRMRVILWTIFLCHWLPALSNVAWAQPETPKLSHPVEHILGPEPAPGSPLPYLQTALLETLDGATAHLVPGLQLTVWGPDSSRATTRLTPATLAEAVHGLAYLIDQPLAGAESRYHLEVQPDLTLARFPSAAGWALDLRVGMRRQAVRRTLSSRDALLLLDHLRAMHRRLQDGLDP